MPEENPTIDLLWTLDFLEDPMLNTLTRGQYYKSFISALEKNAEFTTSSIERLLAVCVHGLENDKKSALSELKIIQLILKRIKAGSFTNITNLLPSILAVLSIIKTSALINRVEVMQKLCFDVLLLYPNETLIDIATLRSSEIVEVLNLYCHQQIPLEIRILPCGLILKLLKILPPEKKLIFVQDHVSLWFSKVMPAAIVATSTYSLNGQETLNSKAMQTLEFLTDELLYLDYADNPEWLEMLESIHNSVKYPALMKRLLANGSNIWHRLWIVFIRLLKNQITRTTNSRASPINSMLPVVEQAFKMDVTNRCRAFQCWDVLIDNFSTETNEAYVVKRLKLLIIPLKSNNAKVEETAMAKLNTWWHLIRSYQTKLEKFVDKILISYLHFCFGRDVGMSPKSLLVPGLFSAKTKKKSVETFVDLAGHLCQCSCMDVNKLNTRIISKTILVDHWNDWVHSLKMAISILQEDVGVTLQQVECLWKSFVMSVAEMPDNNIRKDLFNELLTVIENLAKKPQPTANSGNIIFQLLASLFGETQFKGLFKPKDAQGPLYKILSILLSSSLNIFYRSGDTSEIVSKCKPLANYVLEVKQLIPWLLNCQAQQNISYLLTAIAESVCESKHEDVGELTEFMLWPLKSENFFTDMEYCTKVWVSLVNFLYPNLKTNMKDKLRTAIGRDVIQSNTLFKLHLCISILKYELDNDSVVGCTKTVELLTMVTNKIEDYKYVKDNLQLLTDTIIALVNKVKDVNYSALQKNTLMIVRNLLKFMNFILEGIDETDKVYKPLYENLLQNIEVMVQNTESIPATKIIVEQLLKCITVVQKHPTMKTSVINFMKAYTTACKDADSPLINKVKEALVSLESDISSTKQDIQKSKDDKFAAPTSAKKIKKKETTIVNTVVENGEEYEVIKSNWKFNPRKLTENQKEKLQRKREDIPALYQDLSQSQDEFKLSAWKTDSQDASSTNSRSTSNSKSTSSGNVSEILKNIPSSDVVPKIIENIFSEKKNVDISTQNKPVNEVTNQLKQKSTRDPKSPRMALKDRVFRNVRNLIEKSSSTSAQKEVKDLSESLIQVENVPGTPVSKKTDNTNIINSAPPNLGAERPARLKRKPRKFDDTQVFSLKKNRRTLSLNDSQSDSQMEGQDCVNSNQKSPTEGMFADNEDSVVADKHKADNEPVLTAPKSRQIQPVSLVPNEVKGGTGESSTPELDSTEVSETKSDVKHEKPVHPSEKTKTDVDSKEKPNHEADSNEKSKTKPVADDCNEKTKTKSLADSDENTKNVPETNEKTKTIPGDGNDENTKSTLNEKDKGKNSNAPQSSGDSLSSTDNSNNLDTTTAAAEGESSKVLLNNEDQSDEIKTNSVKDSNKIMKTPRNSKKLETIQPRSGKRNSARTSRIEKELAIDTVEGHPFLKIQTEKRITRKHLNSPLNNSRRKSLTDKVNKTKTDSKTPAKSQNVKKKDKDVTRSESESVSVIIGESQDKCSESSDDIPCSEDVIESSQDSTFTTISVKPSKPALKKLAVVVQKVPLVPSVDPVPENFNNDLSVDKTMDVDDKDDTELPENKTAAGDSMDLELTENMDTQPIDNKAIEEDQNSSDVIIINDDEPIISIGSETQEIALADTQPTPATLSSETQEIADADTQPTNSSDFKQDSLNNKSSLRTDDVIQISNVVSSTQEDMTTTMNESMDVSSKSEDENTVSSPFKDEAQRKRDFLDNTLEISPIKTMSPVRDKKSPSPETSSDYVLIKLSSPVQSNGEPFEKCDSPEIFTEDKVSPDKRDLSPPREENVVNNTSPSSSLSLKKNRPQVRTGGRAAQMLGLCVPDRLQTIMNSERSEAEEPKKNSPSGTPARRNLRILYNSVGGDSSENSEENEDSENFLKLKRVLPTSDSSPANPILKRKLAEITDDATVSPASKRKRVSFHDPPVSTTISVQKYIEPGGIRSPQNSAHKRQERQILRSQTIISKSPKRLDNVFKLDTVLTKAVESFSETEQNSPEITQSMSLDETPAVEIIKNSDLNNVDPICPELVDCNDPIDCIATQLTSATMKTMFLKEVEGRIAKVGDLAKMTELEVNRLCIKAPKVKVAKKVLSSYASQRVVEASEPIETIEIVEDAIVSVDKVCDKMDIEVQTNEVVTHDIEMQTATASMTASCVQTDEKVVAHTSVQTNESGAATTKDVIATCLTERPDFIDSLCQHLEESSKQVIAENLPANMVTDVFMKNVTSANSSDFITRILHKQNGSNPSSEGSNNDLLYLQEYLCDRFDSRDLIMFCSQLLAKVHSKPS